VWHLAASAIEEDAADHGIVAHAPANLGLHAAVDAPRQILAAVEGCQRTLVEAEELRGATRRCSCCRDAGGGDAEEHSVLLQPVAVGKVEQPRTIALASLPGGRAITPIWSKSIARAHTVGQWSDILWQLIGGIGT
jgi:hypothetical protein